MSKSSQTDFGCQTSLFYTLHPRAAIPSRCQLLVFRSSSAAPGLASPTAPSERQTGAAQWKPESMLGALWRGCLAVVFADGCHLTSLERLLWNGCPRCRRKPEPQIPPDTRVHLPACVVRCGPTTLVSLRSAFPDLARAVPTVSSSPLALAAKEAVPAASTASPFCV